MTKQVCKDSALDFAPFANCLRGAVQALQPKFLVRLYLVLRQIDIQR
jgi:hypothetical protein